MVRSKTIVVQTILYPVANGVPTGLTDSINRELFQGYDSNAPRKTS